MVVWLSGRDGELIRFSISVENVIWLSWGTIHRAISVPLDVRGLGIIIGPVSPS